MYPNRTAAQRVGALSKTVTIPADGVSLVADLVRPDDARGLILFAHGSGSGRHSTRNRFVAEQLQQAGRATLLMDLLTVDEDADYANRFDIRLLAGRLAWALEWAKSDDATHELSIGLFGASTGAAAALVVAAVRPKDVAAVVSRGGRPDLAGAATLAKVQVPTLLIVGGADPEVLELNRAAKARIAAATELSIVPGATHLFEEPGALEEVARRASKWFSRWLSR